MSNASGEGGIPEPIHLNLEGDSAALIRAEMEVTGLTEQEIVDNALTIFAFIAPEIRSGAKLLTTIPEVDALKQPGLVTKLLKPLKRSFPDDVEVREVIVGDLCGKPLDLGELNED